LQPYTLNGPHGHLLDAQHNTLSSAAWLTFEMAELMSNKAALAPVLTYIFRTLTYSRPRLDGFGGGGRVLDLGARRSLAWTDCGQWLTDALEGS